jgi:hypothetical protein
MRRDVTVTSIECYDATRDQRMTDADRVLEVLRDAGRALTLAEITIRFNTRYGTRKPESSISGRLNGLEAHGKVTNYQKRPCSITQRVKQTWFLAPSVPHQLQLPEAS